MRDSLVVWSGGADSTLVLYDLARQSSEDHPVRAVSFESDQVAGEKEQFYARNRVINALRKRGHHVRHGTIKIQSSGPFGFDCHGLPQATMWLYAAQCLREDEDLYFGYVKGDDWWCESARFTTMFEQAQAASGRTGGIYTPLRYIHKRTVLHRLQEAKLLDLVWWCGARPEGRKKARVEPCGKCSSCIAHETAVWQLENWGPGTVTAS